MPESKVKSHSKDSSHFGTDPSLALLKFFPRRIMTRLIDILKYGVFYLVIFHLMINKIQSISKRLTDGKWPSVTQQIMGTIMSYFQGPKESMDHRLRDNHTFTIFNNIELLRYK